MCFRSRTTVIDTSAQQAESNRQFEALLAQAEARRQEEARLAQERFDAETARYNDTLTRTQAETERQRAEDRAAAAAEREAQKQAAAEAEARWQAMLAEMQNASTTQSAADRAYADQQTATMRAEAEARAATQKQQYDDLIARQDAQRAAEEAAAGAKADRSIAYNTGRQNLVDAFTAEVNTAYSGFDPAFFQKYIADYQDAANPELDRQRKREQEQLVYGFADAGSIDSRAANRKFAEADRVDASRRASVAQNAYSSAQDLQDKIDGQRRDALTTAFTSGLVGREDLPDGVTDVSGQLARVQQGLSGLAGDVRNRAGSVSANPNADLASVFTNNTLDVSGPRRALQSYGRWGGTGGVNTNATGRTAYTVS